MRQAWERLADRYRAYSLCLPGSASFICQAQLCKAHCCRAFSVNLGEGEVARMEAASGLAAVRFLECEEGEPIVLPMAQPYLHTLFILYNLRIYVYIRQLLMLVIGKRST